MSSSSNTPQDRTPREAASREAEARFPTWKPPTALPDPHQRPGLAHRWVRVSIAGQGDPLNVSQSFREGWEPVLAKDYPELDVLPVRDGRWPDGVEVGGLLLCRTSLANMSQRAAYYRQLTQQQMKSVNDQLEAQEDPRLRTMFRQHRSHIGFGPSAQNDAARIVR